MKTVNELCVSNGVYTWSENMLLLSHAALLKCFIYNRIQAC